jgi:hypothetical protein
MNRARRLGATLMVAAYAFCLFAPTVAFAYAGRASILHVLGESHGGMLVLHFHGGQDHRNHPAKQGQDTVHHCCGVISLPGLEPEAVASIIPPQAAVVLLPPPESVLSGCGAARLERPPRLS